MKVGVVVFPGSNCDHDTLHGVTVCGGTPREIWHKDTSLGDVPIPANSRVLLLWAAADRPPPQDPASPHRDVDGASRGPHFAFGRGLHFCIGAPLARLESRIAIERLLARTTRISLDPDDPPVRRPSILLRRHASLPITVEAPASTPRTPETI